MEVVVTEEKKKIFRARKTMKISDRQQLESLHSTLLTASPAASDDASPPPTQPQPQTPQTQTQPPLMNGTHKEDEAKAGEQNSVSESNSPQAASPASPPPFLSLNLSPSPASSLSPREKEGTPTSPSSPFHSLNFELEKMEHDDKEEQQEEKMVTAAAPSPKESKESPAETETKESEETREEETTEVEKEKEVQTTPDVPDVEPSKSNSDKSPAPPCSPPLAAPAESDRPEPMETDSDATKESAEKPTDGKPSSPKSTTSDPSIARPESSTSTDLKPQLRDQDVKDKDVKDKDVKDQDVKEEDVKEEDVKEEDVKEEDVKEEDVKVKDVKEGEKKKESVNAEKTEADAKVKEEKVGQKKKTTRPSSTPPSNTVQEEKGSTSGLKRTLSDGFDKDDKSIKREGKRPKVERDELEAQLELKFTAKADSHHKLEKIVQQLVDERLRVLELTIFDKHFQELKGRVEKIDCAAKHQNAISALQAKINRLTKKFGEANQASENKRKQEALAAAAAAAAAAANAAANANANAAAAATKTGTVATGAQVQRPVRTSMEVKQIPTAVPTSSAAGLAHTPTSTAMVSQAPILQLITTTSNAGTSLAAGITTQSPTGTLLLKTGPGGGGLMAAGQPLLIQLTNGQAGTLVNIPVSSLSAANPLGKAKTTTSTATFILKPAPATTTAPASAPPAAVATVPALQAPPAAQMTAAQISLARAVFQGGAGGITTPNAGVSVTTARTPAQSVSVAGAMSSASSPATSGPAATGSTAPGPPQGTSLTSKTDNQATASTPTKAAAPTARPKGSVIDLTEDDDDVQVTGVKSATVTNPSSTQRPNPVLSISNSTGARSSPQSNQNSSGHPQLTVHHRPPPQDSPMKSRAAPAASTPTRSSGPSLPPLPAAPVPPRLPPEAERTSPPQQPQLKLVPSQTGIVLSWCVAETDRSCAAVDSYHLYAFHQDNASGGGGGGAAQQHWKKIGEVNALPLPMACTLTQFQSGSTYHFAVRAKDIYGRFGVFCEPQCTNVINSGAS